METNWMTNYGWVDKEDVGYTYNGILAIKKEWNNAICSNMDGPRDYHTKWSRSDRERQILCNRIYMWNIKKNDKWTYLQNRPIGIENRHDYQRGKGGGEINWE